MSRVYVVGAGGIPVGKLTGKTMRAMAMEACRELFRKIDIVPDLVLVSNMSAEQFTGQNHLGVFFADQLGLTGLPAWRIEAACGSGGVAVHQAYIAIKSGLYDAVLVIGVEKMSEVPVSEATSYLAGASDIEWEISSGVTFAGLNALIARRYMHEHHVSSEDLLQFSLISHRNAVQNPLAMFRKPITIEEALNSKIVADPLRLYDCSPVSDGCATVLIVSEKVRKQHPSTNAMEIIASRVATDTISLQDRKNLCELRASETASRLAFKDAGISWKDIGAFEIHDAFSIMAALSIESLGITRKGEACRLAAEGQLEITADYPINTMGGLKARGHPVGATGVYQVLENYLQLTGQAGKNQVPDINYALAQNIGGSGATISINIGRRA